MKAEFLNEIVHTSDYIHPCNVQLSRDAYKQKYRQLIPQLSPHPHLYISESKLRAKDDMGLYTRLIGMGLFTSELLPKKSTVLISQELS